MELFLSAEPTRPPTLRLPDTIPATQLSLREPLKEPAKPPTLTPPTGVSSVAPTTMEVSATRLMSPSMSPNNPMATLVVAIEFTIYMEIGNRMASPIKIPVESNRQPASAVVPVSVTSVRPAIPVGVKVQVHDQFVAGAARLGTAHACHRVGEGSKIAGQVFIRRRPPSPWVIPHGVQLCQVGHLNQAVIIGIVIPTHGGHGTGSHSPSGRWAWRLISLGLSGIWLLHTGLPSVRRKELPG